MLQTVPANFTHFFNPLMFKEVQMDTRKDFWMENLSSGTQSKITQAMDSDLELDSIDIKLKLSIIKSLHAKWLII